MQSSPWGNLLRGSWDFQRFRDLESRVLKLSMAVADHPRGLGPHHGADDGFVLGLARHETAVNCE